MTPARCLREAIRRGQLADTDSFKQLDAIEEAVLEYFTSTGIKPAVEARWMEYRRRVASEAVAKAKEEAS